MFIDNNSSNSFYCSNIFAHLVGEASVPNLSKFKPLFFELYEFVLGNAGKKFDIQNISPNDIGWNKIIEDLINKIQSVPLSKTIKNHVPKGVSSTRGQGMLFCTNQLPTYGCVINSNLPNLNNVFQQDSNIPPNIPNVNDDGEAEDGAISVVEITTIIER
nr:hypothetical protein [Alysiella crassa]UOP06396.1 hypothetical protein LVJ80_11525 [Alysiella crassa]